VSPRFPPTPELDLNGNDPNSSYLSATRAGELAERFDFNVPAGYNLCARINFALSWYEYYSFPPNQVVPSRERREILGRVATKAASVLELIGKLPPDDQLTLESLINDLQVFPEPPNWLKTSEPETDPVDSYPLARIGRDLSSLKTACETRIESLRGLQAGRPLDPIAFVVEGLNKIYFDCTGQQDSYTLSDDGEYHGAFFEFARSCVDHVAPRLSNEALAGHIKRRIRL